MKYKVSDLSKVLGVATNTIRRHEKSGYLKSERDKSDYRWYHSFDINKTAMIRLLIKCDFSHQEIKEMINSSDDNITSIFNSRLNEIDQELNRLYFLRHWLKDNIDMKVIVKNLGDNYTTKKSRPSKYVLYSEGDKLYKEPERLKLINDFMYNVLEVQLIRLYKYDDIIKKDLSNNYGGLMMKTSDIKRLGVEDIIKDSPYISDYPEIDCLYGVLRIPAQDIDNTEIVQSLKAEYLDKTFKYMSENNMSLAGDLYEVYVTVLGDTICTLVCMPYTTKQ